jgi:hypothetical protein
VAAPNPYAKELEYFKAAIELGAGIWLARKAVSGERLPKTYIVWGSVAAFAASAWAFYKAQRMEAPQDRVVPVQEIQSWIPTEVMEAI